MANKKLYTVLSIFIIVGLISLMVYGSIKKNKNTGSTNNDSGIKKSILFYGDTCPHCKQVSLFIQKNNLHKKLSFIEKEVYNNQNNAKELEDVAKKCGLDTYSIGVPFYYSDNKCYVGSKDIIDFMSESLNVSE